MTTGLLVAGLVVLVGALVQGAVGYGMNLIAAPLLTLLDPALVPTPLLLIASTHAVLAVLRERGSTDWPGVGWVMVGRLPGTALGVLAVATLPHGPFGAVVGVAVLVCVLLSVTSWHPRPVAGPLVVAGVAAGALGTAVSIGGPPVALLYQHSEGARIRATLAAVFALGSTMSVIGLVIAGQVTVAHLIAAAWLVPFLVAGFALSSRARRILDAGRMRTAVLTVAVASSIALIVRSALG
ncbi:sulfite exporter TauE/SafE family protein [Amycolatopsis suaedae]|uniref:Probable membrane transporter protein n=1 Tax=Amycolatopsis suaedae TaxID=2510978 RepID=A0A4V2EM65_9PSEU|nr:sulfite exporter TauE/SafE family protein [Amycolatopsis suaedae]